MKRLQDIINKLSHHFQCPVVVKSAYPEEETAHNLEMILSNKTITRYIKDGTIRVVSVKVDKGIQLSILYRGSIIHLDWDTLNIHTNNTRLSMFASDIDVAAECLIPQTPYRIRLGQLEPEEYKRACSLLEGSILFIIQSDPDLKLVYGDSIRTLIPMVHAYDDYSITLQVPIRFKNNIDCIQFAVKGEHMVSEACGRIKEYYLDRNVINRLSGDKVVDSIKQAIQADIELVKKLGESYELTINTTKHYVQVVLNGKEFNFTMSEDIVDKVLYALRNQYLDKVDNRKYIFDFFDTLIKEEYISSNSVVLVRVNTRNHLIPVNALSTIAWDRIFTEAKDNNTDVYISIQPRRLSDVHKELMTQVIFKEEFLLNYNNYIHQAFCEAEPPTELLLLHVSTNDVEKLDTIKNDLDNYGNPRFHIHVPGGFHLVTTEFDRSLLDIWQGEGIPVKLIDTEPFTILATV